MSKVRLKAITGTGMLAAFALVGLAQAQQSAADPGCPLSPTGVIFGCGFSPDRVVPKAPTDWNVEPIDFFPENPNPQPAVPSQPARVEVKTTHDEWKMEPIDFFPVPPR